MCLKDLMDRAMKNPLAMLIPFLNDKGITAAERRFIANARILRNHIRKLIEERKAGMSQSYRGSGEKDLLDLLVSEELYRTNEERLIDDIIVMFIAGMETIQMSTTNLVQQLTIQPDLKKKLIEETEPVITEAEKTDIVKGLTTEKVDDFNFTRNCFYESLRCDPPTTVSGAACFMEDVKIGKVVFPKNLGFVLCIFMMHMDASEWVYPTSFIPDRFDSTSPYFLRPDNTKRSSLSFNPFLGGKRVCLGKSFAEIAIRNTVPLLFHHIDFELAEQGQSYKTYHMGQIQTPEVKLKFKVKRIPKTI